MTPSNNVCNFEGANVDQKLDIIVNMIKEIQESQNFLSAKFVEIQAENKRIIQDNTYLKQELKKQNTEYEKQNNIINQKPTWIYIIKNNILITGILTIRWIH